MNNPAEQYIIRVMNGRQRGLGASLLRGALAAAEPFYSGIVSLRNRRYNRGRGVKKLPRPVISVGNITAGGTGKTPVVRWLCEQLRAAGRHPAVLLRGYKSTGGVSDEQRMLQDALNGPGQTPIVVHINPNRFAGGNDVLREHPEVDVFVLDDGFQHRRLARDVDLVLINATEPFGHDRVHPRGLLREPLRGLRRAHAVLITRSDEVDAEALAQIEQRIREHAAAPIFHAMHAQVGFRSNSAFHPIEELAGKRLFAFCGIGDPESFLRQLQSRAGNLVGSRVFADHHVYTDRDLGQLNQAAATAGAEALVTTEKDWAKLGAAIPSSLPIWRIEMAIRFRLGDEATLLRQMVPSPPVLRGRGLG